MSAGRPIRTTWHEDSGVLAVQLDRPAGNILDAAMVASLRAMVREEAARPEVRAVLFSGAGAHFSFGASVEEHLPGTVATMLEGFHALFRELVALQRPLLAAVRGQCLGGGLELASFCQRVVATPTAKFGQPEIMLGVFAPVGSFVLPRRIGQSAADDLLLSGRIILADEALELGLVDVLAEDPVAELHAWSRRHLMTKSAASLGIATSAARYEFNQAFHLHIERLKRLYLADLMGLRDAEEGIRAFLEKRTPIWSHQ